MKRTAPPQWLLTGGHLTGLEEKRDNPLSEEQSALPIKKESFQTKVNSCSQAPRESAQGGGQKGKGNCLQPDCAACSEGLSSFQRSLNEKTNYS